MTRINLVNPTFDWMQRDSQAFRLHLCSLIGYFLFIYIKIFVPRAILSWLSRRAIESKIHEISPCALFSFLLFGKSEWR